MTDEQGLVTGTRAMAAELGDGWRLPVRLMTAESFGLTDPHDVAWVNRRLTDETLRWMDEPLQLRDGLAQIPSKTYIRTERFPVPFRDRLFERLAADPQWHTESWDVGHDVMIEAPERVVELLIAVAGRER